MADFDVYERTLKLPNALRAGMDYFAAVWEDADHNKELAKHKITMPVLAVGGRQSIGEGVAHAAEQFAEDIKGTVIDDAGHWLTDEAPETLAGILLDFFQ